LPLSEHIAVRVLWHNIGETTMRHDQHAPQPHLTRLLTGICGLLLGAATSLAADARAQGPSEKGLWFNNSGKGAVEIRPCADTGRDANYLCGFIVWLKRPNNARGEPLTDGHNQDPQKRTRPICGLPVLGQLRPMTDGTWDQGWVYDPENGKSFNAAIQLRTSDRLILTGYKGIKFFSRSFEWKRAPDDLPRCDNAVGSTLQQAASAKTASPPLPDKASPARASQLDVLTPPRPVPAVKPPAAALR
jgi:uncharacterized protein (DUF2147 family)